MFTLAISCLTTSNLPWFMDLTFQVPMPHCSLQHRTLLITHHIHNWELFLLWLCLFILSGVISPLFSSILGTYRPGEFFFSILSFCLFILSTVFSRQEYWRGFHSLLQRTLFCQNSPPFPICPGWPYTAWLIVSLSQTRLLSMCSVWLVFCDYDFHLVCPLRR